MIKAKSAVGRGRHLQTDMIAHQGTRVDTNRRARREGCKHVKEHPVTGLAKEDRTPIDAPSEKRAMGTRRRRHRTRIDAFAVVCGSDYDNITPWSAGFAVPGIPAR